eukprot:m.137685 g.137685  ORF g.137685 m.137685 type:complete len:373 (-) comp16608_c0_seq2:301-1419(-)
MCSSTTVIAATATTASTRGPRQVVDAGDGEDAAAAQGAAAGLAQEAVAGVEAGEGEVLAGLRVGEVDDDVEDAAQGQEVVADDVAGDVAVVGTGNGRQVQADVEDEAEHVGLQALERLLEDSALHLDELGPREALDAGETVRGAGRGHPRRPCPPLKEDLDLHHSPGKHAERAEHIVRDDELGAAQRRAPRHGRGVTIGAVAWSGAVGRARWTQVWLAVAALVVAGGHVVDEGEADHAEGEPEGGPLRGDGERARAAQDGDKDVGAQGNLQDADAVADSLGRGSGAADAREPGAGRVGVVLVQAVGREAQVDEGVGHVDEHDQGQQALQLVGQALKQPLLGQHERAAHGAAHAEQQGDVVPGHGVDHGVVAV